jgi:hypothetical protein
MMREYEYCLDTCSLYVSVDTYKRKENFGWMEMGIVVKIQVPIHCTELIRYQTYQMPNLPDTKLVKY